MRDGVLNTFSVGFLPLEHRMDDNVLVRTKADLKEVSVVAFPAYAGAKVSEVRTEEKTNNKESYEMTEEVKYAPVSDVADLRESVTDLERRMAMGAAPSTEVKPLFRNGAELLKALASGSSEARDFATSVDADITRPAWVNERLRLAVANRPVINAFGKGVLPATGNSIEYPFVLSTTGTVAQQVNEATIWLTWRLRLIPQPLLLRLTVVTQAFRVRLLNVLTLPTLKQSWTSRHVVMHRLLRMPFARPS